MRNRKRRSTFRSRRSIYRGRRTRRTYGVRRRGRSPVRKRKIGYRM